MDNCADGQLSNVL